MCPTVEKFKNSGSASLNRVRQCDQFCLSITSDPRRPSHSFLTPHNNNNGRCQATFDRSRGANSATWYSTANYYTFAAPSWVAKVYVEHCSSGVSILEHHIHLTCTTGTLVVFFFSWLASYLHDLWSTSRFAMAKHAGLQTQKILNIALKLKRQWCHC